MDVTAILIECACMFGRHARGCDLAPDAAVEFGRIFDETIRIAVARNPDQWDDTEQGRDFALDMVRQIAGGAAEMTGGEPITSPVLRRAADRLIDAVQRQEKLPPLPELRFMSPFCFAYQIRGGTKGA